MRPALSPEGPSDTLVARAAGSASGSGEPLLGRRSLTARLLEHPVILVGAPRALLLQVAHPLVAAGVTQHSRFEDHPLDRVAGTLDLVGTIAFGTPDQASAARRRLRRAHAPVRGRAPDGRTYRAGRPDLLMWVHATLVDTLLAIDRRYLGLLRGRRELFYAESRAMAAALEIPLSAVPANLDAFAAYMRDMVEKVEIGEDARRVAASVLRPPLRPFLGPVAPGAEHALAPFLEAVTADLLPPRLRRAYHLPRSPLGAPIGAALGMGAYVSRLLAPRVPTALFGPLSVPSLSGYLSRVSTTAKPR